MTNFEEQLKSSLSHAYDIERELGGGGMSRVFVATDKSLGRHVVIKVLSPELTAEVNRGRFRREIQVAAQLQHPHIVTLLSAGEYGEIVYYTMPFIKGESLKSALEKDGALSVGEVVRVLYDVVDALAYAHENGVVHRDIKPANILRSGAHALVTDFGVAKALNAAMPSSAMTSTGMAFGTPAYMSPEQLAGDPSADHRIDIYAVGLLAYELLAGKSPFAVNSPRGILAAVLTWEPPPLVEVRSDTPQRLSEMVMKCLSKEPAGRPPSAHAMMEALDTFSMSSGEIRTREHRVPKVTPAAPAPVPAPVAAALNPPVSNSSVILPVKSSGTFPEHAVTVGESTAPDQAPTYAAGSSTTKIRTKKLVGVAAFLVPVAAGAIFLSQRPGVIPPIVEAPPATVPVVDSSLPPLPVPAAIAGGQPAIAPAAVDSKAKTDSAKARAARAEAARRAAAFPVDSVAPTVDQGREVRSARWAATALFADADAQKSFIRGASRSRKKGDLQTQIDALQPFLTKYGLTYDRFKAIAKESGANLFDEFGRMVPEAMQRFAAGAN
ncbi:MAG: protein kinase [Gemmatimonadaceae bacterium]